jgi:hypothetical protein
VCIYVCISWEKEREERERETKFYKEITFYVENTFYREHGLYREHDASQVHVTCYATTPSDHSHLRHVAEETCHAFHLVASWSDDRVAQVSFFNF